MGLVFLSVQLPYVFWLEHLSHLLKVIINKYVFSAILLLDYFPFFCLSLFLLLKARLLTFAAVLVWC